MRTEIVKFNDGKYAVRRKHGLFGYEYYGPIGLTDMEWWPHTCLDKAVVDSYEEAVALKKSLNKKHEKKDYGTPVE